ncbi:hypothetical protein DVH05_023750 [Phytophthora capsici]|nr:hypothetical protein DVH05_023750 [Phytophthora capsici]
MKVSSIVGGLSLLLSTPLVAAYANPETCTGICTNTHDPSIIRRSDGTYFRFSTGGRIAVHSAPDIVGPWMYLGAAVPDGSTIDLDGKDDLWAPDVHLVGDEYYLYYSVSTFGSQNSAIGLTRSSTLDINTWTDLGSTGVSSTSGESYNTIDPNLIDVDGTYYLNFGSSWQDIYQVEMPKPAKSTGSPSQIAFTSDDEVMEGSYMFKYGDFYYLFLSKGKCCGYDTSKPASGKEYRILVCRSTSATGDFVDQDGASCKDGGGTVVLESHDEVYGPGGQGIYDDPTYGPVLYYHYVNTTIGYADGDKRFGWNRLDFSSGWPTL